MNQIRTWGWKAAGIVRLLQRAWTLLKALVARPFFGTPRLLQHDSGTNIALLRLFGATVGKGVRLHAPITLHAAETGYRNLHIGDGCMFNGNNYLDLSGRIILEVGVSLGPGVIINTHNRFNYNEYLETILANECGVRDVRIGEGSGIKANALVVMGVTIGRHCVVAGGAVVNRDVPDYSFVAGIPAKVKRQFPPEDNSN
jgi:acetyltransferase-like isoleucine patch superfamily enzyme